MKGNDSAPQSGFPTPGARRYRAWNPYGETEFASSDLEALKSTVQAWTVGKGRWWIVDTFTGDTAAEFNNGKPVDGIYTRSGRRKT